MTFCKHQRHKVIDWIKEPRYHDDMVLINVSAIVPDTEHYLIKFVKCNKYPDWFYMSGKDIRRQKIQANGRGEVYVVPMSKREDFAPIKRCQHDW